MDFLKELQWRGMLHDMSPGLDEELKKPACKAYIGFDPTAPSLTIGNYVQIMMLKFFQQAGHQPIVLMGGATGMIGDPSFKDKERELKNEGELVANLNHQKEQFEKLLGDFDLPGGPMMMNNHDFYKDMNALTFLRDVGKSLTVNYMMAKDSVRNRLDTGLSFTEFSYQLLQAYDFYHLYKNFGCKIQMGGSDQWGNITSGTEYIRRNIKDGKAYAVTTPLLTKADGTKFGKSESGNIWLDPNLTSPYQFFQFWLNADDRDLPRFLKTFSLKPKKEIVELVENIPTDPNTVKRVLAEELCTRIHSAEDTESVETVSSLLFDKKFTAERLEGLKPEILKMVAMEIPSININIGVLGEGLTPTELLTEHSSFFKSKSELRRIISGNALSINKRKVTDIEHQFDRHDLVAEKYILIESGKKKKFMLIVQ
ncbi:MAG: tyrosine--tRNA ligase [Saprospirales bacterium]|nr:MAG: tyrosine--tRNA ligase [Saprospirales bacterium]